MKLGPDFEGNMAILFFDCETNGLPLWREHNDHPAQPHIVQLAMLLTDGTGKPMAQFCSLIYPVAWDIGEDVQQVHNITKADCENYGVEIFIALGLLRSMVASADIVVAHNISFDQRMADIEAMRLKYERGFVFDGPTFTGQQRQSFCTMKATTNICQLSGQYGYKWPKLIEAYRFFFGKDFDKAHDAMADVRACAEIYFELKKRESCQTQPTQS